jgi:hypothetical protein
MIILITFINKIKIILLRIIFIYIFNLYKVDIFNSFISLDFLYKVQLTGLFIFFLFFFLRYLLRISRIIINITFFFRGGLLIIFIILFCIILNSDILFCENKTFHKEKIIGTVIVCSAVIIGSYYMYKNLKVHMYDTQKFLIKSQKDFEELAIQHAIIKKKSLVVYKLQKKIVAEDLTKGEFVKTVNDIIIRCYTYGYAYSYNIGGLTFTNSPAYLPWSQPYLLDDDVYHRFFIRPLYFSPYFVYKTFGKDGYEQILNTWKKELGSLDMFLYHSMAVLPSTIKDFKEYKNQELFPFIWDGFHSFYALYNCKNKFYVDMLDLEHISSSNIIFENIPFVKKSYLISFDISIIFMHFGFSLLKFCGLSIYNPIRSDYFYSSFYRALSGWSNFKIFDGDHYVYRNEQEMIKKF